MKFFLNQRIITHKADKQCLRELVDGERVGKLRFHAPCSKLDEKTAVSFESTVIRTFRRAV